MVGEASETGTLELLQKARGAKKSLQAAYEELLKAGYAGGRIVMAHRSNEKFCQQLSELLREKYPQANIKNYPYFWALQFLCRRRRAPHGIRNQLINLTRDV